MQKGREYNETLLSYSEVLRNGSDGHYPSFQLYPLDGGGENRLSGASPVRRVECKYKHSTTFADIVYIDVSVAEFKGVVLRLNYRMEKADGSLVCEAYSEHCFLDAEGKILRVDQAYPALYAALNEDK